MGNANPKAAHQVLNAMKGLSQEQRMRVNLILGEQSTNEGWSLYRMPTTQNPPTTLRLLKRDGHGNLTQVVGITESGVTK
jgi:hypothetical protein